MFVIVRLIDAWVQYALSGMQPPRWCGRYGLVAGLTAIPDDRRIGMALSERPE
jgi:hypothetical protein